MAIADARAPAPPRRLPALPWPRLDALQRRRLANFRANRRGYWALRIFGVLFAISLCAELIANDRPYLMSFQGRLVLPMISFVSERDLGGFHGTRADFRDPYVQCLIRTGGDDERCDADEGAQPAPGVRAGWTLWPPIPFRPTRPTGWAPTTRPATCWPASSTASASACSSR